VRGLPSRLRFGDADRRAREQDDDDRKGAGQHVKTKIPYEQRGGTAGRSRPARAPDPTSSGYRPDVIEPLPAPADDDDRTRQHALVRRSIEALLEGEDDWVAAMATVVCELHHAFAWHDWTGFYRTVAPGLLAIGPYQGGHGCLRIPFDRGVCGAAARTKTTQLVDDVHAVADHIACSSTTRAEIVVPVLDARGQVIAVLDIDSDTPAAFRDADRVALESLCRELGLRYGERP